MIKSLCCVGSQTANDRSWQCFVVYKRSRSLISASLYAEIDELHRTLSNEWSIARQVCNVSVMYHTLITLVIHYPIHVAMK